NILSTLLNKLIDFNQQIVKIQAELIEKSRLSAVTETVLALSHEINNPLMIIRGNLELLETGISQSGSIPVEDKDRFIRIKNNFERIMNVTNKMANLSKPVSRVVAGGINMIDLSKSE
ncbi:MAG: hypothetical protein JW946_01735, partial [Candidatus Omnitrophica bacterium]|nr:hypothetical protein [Candidatus Omnitrophota bacterium]